MPLGPVLLCDLIAANGRSTRVQVVSAAALLGAAYTKLNREALAPAVGPMATGAHQRTLRLVLAGRSSGSHPPACEFFLETAAAPALYSVHIVVTSLV